MTALQEVAKSRPSKILFACVHNAGRSQMASALFNAAADPSQAFSVSAGTVPSERVHPQVVEAMREVGIDLANVRPQRLTDDVASGVDRLVTMGCGEIACPVIPTARREAWPLTDPSGKTLEEVRVIRDDIRRRVMTLIRQQRWAREQA